MKKVLFVNLVLALFFFLCACSRSRDTLSFNLTRESIQLDWHKANDNASVIVLDNIMEGLTSYADVLQSNTQAELLRPLPALASSWSISENGTLYRFHIREGVRWSDGEPLKAQHFVDSWQRLLDPEAGSEGAYRLFDILGAQDFATAKSNDFSKLGVRAVDAQTLEVKLRRPASYFLHLLATPGTFPLRKDLIEKYGANWTNVENLVVLGPYQLQEWNHGDRIVLIANKKYWGAAPSIKKVICKMISEPLTALALYTNGDLDILPRDLPVSYASYWKDHEDYLTGPKLAVSYLALNTRKPPFNSVENRRDFAKSVNRQELAKIFQGTQSPISSFIPPGMFGHMPGLGITFDEHALTKKMGVLRLRYNANDNFNLMFQGFEASLRASGGSTLRLEPTEWKEYKETLVALASKRVPPLAEQPNILYVSWVADYPDPHSFMNIFTKASEGNQTGWTNTRYDALVESAVETENESQRMSLYEQAQHILLEEDAAIVPVFFTSHQALAKADIKGVVLNPLDKWYFKNFHFEP